MNTCNPSNIICTQAFVYKGRHFDFPLRFVFQADLSLFRYLVLILSDSLSLLNSSIKNLSFYFLYSVLSAEESCCAWLCANSTSARVCVRALAACAPRPPLAVRLAYTLGNMAAADEQARANVSSSVCVRV